MSGKKSRNKGSSAEREVAKLLTAWWPEAKFSRTPLSGGWGNKKEFNTGGDIICSDKRFPFSVEVKHRQGWSEDRLFSGKKSPVWKWIKQCEDESDKNVPLLFFRKNRMDWWIAIPTIWRSSSLGTAFRITLPEKFWHQAWDLMPAEMFFKTSPSDWSR